MHGKSHSTGQTKSSTSMRLELEQLEQIDQYLSGKMSSTEVATFEQQMNADPALKSMVNDQQLLIQTVARRALMAEINGVAGLGAGASAGWGLTQWLLSSLAIIGFGIGGYFIYDSLQTDELLVDKVDEIVVIEQEIPAPDTGSIFSFALEEGLDEYEDNIEYSNGYSSSIELGNPAIEKNDPKMTTPKLIPQKVEKMEPKLEPKNDTKKLFEGQQPVHNMDENRSASFPGGIMKMKAFFKKEMRYPRTPKDKGLSGTVKVTFLVTADGKIGELDSECFIIKDEFGKPLNTLKFAANGKSRKIFEGQAERIFRMSSPWTPATNSQGNPVLSEQAWYVNFDLKGESSIYQLEEDRVIGPANVIQEK
jgi:hypothetical protein